MTKKLSAVITTYKRDVATVARAVDSIAGQTYPDIEIIVVDDNENGSSFSGELAARFQSVPGVTYVKQDGNQGACAARNLGIRSASGEYIGFLDDDDAWEPEKAAQQMSLFKDNVGLVFCKGRQIDETMSPPQESTYYNGLDFKEHLTFKDLLIRDRIGTTSQAIVKKACFLKCGGFDEKLPARQDYEMWLRISRHFDVAGVNAYLFKRYIHGGDQISKSSRRALQGYLRIHELYAADFKTCAEAQMSISGHIWVAAKNSGEFQIYAIHRLRWIFLRWLFRLRLLKRAA